MRLLVPVDGSAHSLEAVKAASRYAASGAPAIFFILTVVPYVEGIDLALSVSQREAILGSFTKRGEDVLERAKEILSSLGAQYIRTVLSVASSAAEEIVSFSERERIDLIVMGSRGVGEDVRFPMGSVASKVVRHSPSSVFVVREAPHRQS